MNSAKTSKNQWLDELDDIVRGASGGFLFGVPLLYTMEVWWIGSSTNPPRMLIAIALTFLIIFLLNQTSGFRKTASVQILDAAKDSVEALAIGIICATVILILLQEITLQTALHESLGKAVFESIPFALGVALANQFLSGSEEVEQPPQSATDHLNQRKSHAHELNETLSDIGGTLIGGLIIAFNIAPTDEIPMLAAAVSGPWLLAIITASLLISYGIVFQAGFANQNKRRQQRGIFQRPLSETVMSYLISLISAALMLAFFEKLSLTDPWTVWLSHTLLLGLPATVGGAAGRLAI